MAGQIKKIRWVRRGPGYVALKVNEVGNIR
jgi:hypothetical protein